MFQTSGRVNSNSRAAAVAKRELTAGIISKDIFFSLKASICSPIAPYIEGSPVCTVQLFFHSLSHLPIIITVNASPAGIFIHNSRL
jgi:hypothetical protein